MNDERGDYVAPSFPVPAEAGSGHGTSPRRRWGEYARFDSEFNSQSGRGNPSRTRATISLKLS